MNNENIGIALVFLLSLLLAWGCIHEGHSWGGDFSLYIAQAKALLDGRLPELFEANKYMMEEANRTIGPYLYPPGFPLLLSPVYYFFGLDFFYLKLFCASFFLCSLPLLYRLSYALFQRQGYAFLLLLLIACNFHFLSFSNYVLSDLPFFFFNLLVLWLIPTCKTTRQLLLLGALIYFTYSIRDVGIILLPTLLSYQVALALQQGTFKTRWIIPYFTFLLLAIGVSFITISGNTNLFGLFSSVTFASIGSNIYYYAQLITIYILGPHISPLPIAWVFPWFFIFLGLIPNIKSHLYLLVYATCLFLIYFIWPAKQGFRFIFPAIPIVLYFLINGIDFFAKKCNIPYANIALLGLIALLQIPANIYRTVSYADTFTNYAYDEEMRGLYDFIKREIPSEKKIGFFKPRVLRLFTDRPALYHHFKKPTKTEADYILVSNKLLSPEYSDVVVTEHLALRKRNFK